MIVPDEKCYARYVTENDNPCMNGTENTKTGNCIVDPKSEKFRREKKLDRSNNNLRQGKIKKEER